MPASPAPAPRLPRRLAVRGLTLLLWMLQVLAPWLHAHTSVSRTVGFHLHLATVVRPSDAPMAVAIDAFTGADDSASVSMPGGWLRDGEPWAAEAPALAARSQPVAVATGAVVLRVRQRQAPRPPPALALVAYASQAPPAASSSLMTRG